MPRIDSIKLGFTPFEMGFGSEEPVPAIYTSKPVSFVKVDCHSIAVKQFDVSVLVFF